MPAASALLESFAVRHVGTMVIAHASAARTLRALMKAKVIVMPKQNILDPQGVAVRDAIRHHGIESVKGARIGKFIELEVDGVLPETTLHELCRDLLSNPVVEDYVLDLEK
jgi:phosphoribosylformylglycinamidine synthase